MLEGMTVAWNTVSSGRNISAKGTHLQHILRGPTQCAVAQALGAR